MLHYAKKLLRFESPTKFDWLVYFFAFGVLHIPAVLNFYENQGLEHAYMQFAGSLLEGNLYLPQMSSYDDMIFYNGKHYLPYPPFPSIVLLPFVAIFGSVNTVLLVIVMSCLNLWLLYRILIKIGTDLKYIPWLIAAFFFGTGYWFALFTSHHVYTFAHIISCTLQLLVIYEILHRRRWGLVGLLIGFSFLTRQFTFLYLVFSVGYLVYLTRTKQVTNTFKPLFWLLGCFGFSALSYMLYNYLRFDNILDTGYAYILFNGVLAERVNEYGVFSARYVLFNLYSFFLKGFNIEFDGPALINLKGIDLWGTGLFAASPFLITSLKASWPKTLRYAAWTTIGLILTGIVFYHNNGFHQVNTMRFSLDFLPLLFVLTALGIRSIPEWLVKGMIVYAVVLNLIAFAIHFISQ